MPNKIKGPTEDTNLHSLTAEPAQVGRPGRTNVSMRWLRLPDPTVECRQCPGGPDFETKYGKLKWRSVQAFQSFLLIKIIFLDNSSYFWEYQAGYGAI